MNKPLLAFGILFIIGGIFTGLSIVIVLGIFFLIPGLLTTPKPISRVPVSRGQQPRRVTPPPAPQRVQAAPTQPPSTTTLPISSSAQESTGPAYAPALFPTAMFPTLSLPSTYQMPRPEKKEQAGVKSDELVEFGVILAALKLAFA